MTFAGAGDGGERANFEPALASVTQRLGVRI
jgi:hypothetical protein